jgi:hypothetical protein
MSRARRCRTVEDGSAMRACRASRRNRGRVARGVSPPAQVAEVKALACELPSENGVPLSRYSSSEVAREAVKRGIVAEISDTTVWRWLAEDAIRPWNHRSWIFPRDPNFAAKAGRVLDLYEGRWEGELLHPGDYVVCADEKPSIQARGRCHPTLPAASGGGLRVEHECERKGALCYLAAWDVRRARIFDRCAAKDGIVPFDALVEQFMSVEPYRCAQRVFVIVDNGSAHRGQRSIDRLQGAWPNLILVHTPVHASWLNQAEIFFSVVQRKVLTPTTSQASTPSSNDYTRSPDTTNRSPNRSNGSSPDKTSASSSPAPATTSTSGWPHDPTTQLRNGPLRERRRPS